MKKIKSIFALLLLGSLTMTGCDLFKKKGNDTPSDGGGGGVGDGGGVVDRFTNKKFNYDSCDVPEAAAGYEGTYVSLFTEGDFEIVLGSYVMCGDYTLSADKQSAAMTMKKQKSAYGEYVFPADQQETINVEYVASIDKYSVATTNPETGQTAHMYYVDSGEQPTHYEFPPAQTVTISFNKNAADAEGEMNPLTKNKGEVFALPGSGFTYDGHTFQGWSESATEGPVHTAGSPYSSQVDVTLYAHWQEVPAGKLTVTFDANASGATGETAPIEVDPGEAFHLPECGFSLEGHDFIGWCVEAVPSNPEAIHPVGVECSVTASTTYYAQWQPKSSGDETLLNTFKLMGLENDWTTGETGVDATDPEEVADHQYVEQIKFEFSVEAEHPVEVKVVGGSVFLGYEALPNDCKALASSGENDNIRIEAEGDYTLFLKKYEGGDLGLWLAKEGGGDQPGDETLLETFKLMGLEDDWTTGETGVDATDPEEVADHQYVEQIKFEFSVEAEHPVEVKVVGGEVYLGYDNLPNDCKALASSGENDNIRIEAEGDYTLFLKKYEGGDLGLWLAKEGAEPVVNPPFIQYGSDEAGWEKAALTWTGSQHQIEGLALAADTEVVICISNDVWYHWSEYVQTEPDGGHIKKSGDNLQVDAAGTYDFYINGGHIYVVYHAPSV